MSTLMLTVSLTEVTGIFALRKLAVHCTSKINVSFIVLFISQLVVGLFFSCLALTSDVVNLVIIQRYGQLNQFQHVFLFGTGLRGFGNRFVSLSFLE